MRDEHGFSEVFDCYDAHDTGPGQLLAVPDVRKVGTSELPNQDHPAGVITDQAIRFVQQHQNQPFCLWFSFDGPHMPICSSFPWATQYDPQSLSVSENVFYSYDRNVPKLDRFQTKMGTMSDTLHRQILAYYYGYVTQIDHNIGRLLDHLDALGLADETAVFFTSDHGEMMGAHGIWTKANPGYDAVTRVPLMLRCPGIVSPGTVNTATVELIDVLPTALELAGISCPDTVQGQSLLSVLEDPGKSRKFAVTEVGLDPENATITLRYPEHKYVEFRKGSHIVHAQVFDLVDDPHETRNLIDQESGAALAKSARDDLAKWERDTPIRRDLIYAQHPGGTLPGGF